MFRFFPIIIGLAYFTGLVESTATIPNLGGKSFDESSYSQTNAALVLNNAIDGIPDEHLSSRRQRRSIISTEDRTRNNLNLRETVSIISTIEDPDSKVVQQEINYTIPNWEEILDNNFATGAIQFEANTSFNLTARWRMIIQESNGKLVFSLALMESNQNPIWAIYNVQILKSNLIPLSLRYPSRYPINRYGDGTGQRKIWGWSLVDIGVLQDPLNEIITDNKLSLRVTVTTYGKGHPLYSGATTVTASASTAAAAT